MVMVRKSVDLLGSPPSCDLSMCVVICWSVCCRMMAWYLLAFWSATRMLRKAVGVLWVCLGFGRVMMVEVFHWYGSCCVSAIFRNNG